MDWPGFDEPLWHATLTQVSSRSSAHPFILASDRDAGAINSAQANAERAGVSEYIDFQCQAVSSIQPPSGTGWVVTNPPYGLRLDEGRDLRNLYAQFGNVLRRKCPGWELSVLCSETALLGQMRLKFDTSLAFVNGGIHVRLGRGVVTN